jgi:hypothetical protein
MMSRPPGRSRIDSRHGTMTCRRMTHRIDTHKEVTVAEYRHPVLRNGQLNGQYQIVALAQADGTEVGVIAHYAVATSAGAILRQGLTLFEARTWLQLLLADEAIAKPPTRTR